ncbi:glycerophosphodiester phosphodiesterase family protein [Bacillus licheniformis]|nr:glycerophosphodiester phosphodiesterase family protein [Bacillus licheniformis]
MAADPTLVPRIHALGMKITPWTVRSRDEVPPLLKAGVDGIVTDFPDYVPKKYGSHNKKACSSLCRLFIHQ